MPDLLRSNTLLEASGIPIQTNILLLPRLQAAIDIEQHPDYDPTEGQAFLPYNQPPPVGDMSYMIEPNDLDGHPGDTCWGTKKANLLPMIRGMNILANKGPNPPLSPLHVRKSIPSVKGHPRTTSTVKRSKKSSHKHRRERRQEASLHTIKVGCVKPTNVRLKHIASSIPISTTVATETLPVTGPGFTALRSEKSKRIEIKEYSLEDVLRNAPQFGFRIQEWDGIRATPILDSEGRVVALLGGRPQSPEWEIIHNEAAQRISEARGLCEFSAKDASHRRCRSPSLACGFSFGGGQKVPGNLGLTHNNHAVMTDLIQCSAIQRIAGFSNGLFAAWAPRLYKYYSTTMSGLLGHHPQLRMNFKNSVWSAMTFNFGPKTICLPHRDFSNLAFGWCAITALGDFDPKKGGHLLLWDIKLAIEFPPGSTVLIPSAIFCHSNTKVQAHETRVSCTQYAAGGLFRWVEHGYRTANDFMMQDPIGKLACDLQSSPRWKRASELFSTYSELRGESPSGS